MTSPGDDIHKNSKEEPSIDPEAITSSIFVDQSFPVEAHIESKAVADEAVMDKAPPNDGPEDKQERKTGAESIVPRDSPGEGLNSLSGPTLDSAEWMRKAEEWVIDAVGQYHIALVPPASVIPISILAAVVRGDNLEAKRMAAAALASRSAEEAVPPLLDGLRKPGAHEFICSSLGHFGLAASEAAPELARLLNNGEPYDLHFKYAQALEAIGGEEAVKGLARGATSKDKAIRSTVELGLLFTQDGFEEVVVPIIREAFEGLSEEDPRYNVLKHKLSYLGWSVVDERWCDWYIERERNIERLSGFEGQRVQIGTSSEYYIGELQSIERRGKNAFAWVAAENALHRVSLNSESMIMSSGASCPIIDSR